MLLKTQPTVTLSTETDSFTITFIITIVCFIYRRRWVLFTRLSCFLWPHICFSVFLSFLRLFYFIVIFHFLSFFLYERFCFNFFLFLSTDRTSVLSHDDLLETKLELLFLTFVNILFLAFSTHLHLETFILFQIYSVRFSFSYLLFSLLTSYFYFWHK